VLAHNFQEALAVFRHGCNKKNNKLRLMGWHCFFLLPAGVGYLTLMPVIRFFFAGLACLHEHG
jgi:hypothetical protein